MIDISDFGDASREYGFGLPRARVVEALRKIAAAVETGDVNVMGAEVNGTASGDDFVTKRVILTLTERRRPNA